MTPEPYAGWFVLWFIVQSCRANYNFTCNQNLYFHGLCPSLQSLGCSEIINSCVCYWRLNEVVKQVNYKEYKQKNIVLAEQSRKCFYLKFHSLSTQQMFLLLSMGIIYGPLYASKFRILNFVVVSTYCTTLSLGYLCSFMILLSLLYLPKFNMMNRKLNNFNDSHFINLKFHNPPSPLLLILMVLYMSRVIAV